MNATSRIYIAGHRGLVGSAILRNLQARGYTNFVLRTHAEWDLERQADVEAFFERHPAPKAGSSIPEVVKMFYEPTTSSCDHDSTFS